MYLGLYRSPDAILDSGSATAIKSATISHLEFYMSKSQCDKIDGGMQSVAEAHREDLTGTWGLEIESLGK